MADLLSSVSLTSTSTTSSPVVVSTASSNRREVTIELTDLDVDTQPAISTIINDPKIKKLRAVFSSVKIASFALECHTVARMEQMGDLRPVRFGLTGARNASIAAADAIELPYLSTIIFSNVAMVKETNTRLPPGLNTDLACVALHSGHPVVIITTDGSITAATADDVVAATSLVSGFITLDLDCSGTGPGYEYDL